MRFPLGPARRAAMAAISNTCVPSCLGPCGISLSLRSQCWPPNKLSGTSSHASMAASGYRLQTRLLHSSFTGATSPVPSSISLPRSSALRASVAGNTVCLQDVEELPEPLQKIVKKFQMGGLPDTPETQRMRYQQLLMYASKLQPLPKEYHVPENKVEGCVSQVWVLPTLRDGLVYFQADSDSQLVKGLAALLVEGLSGATPEAILRVKPDFVQMLGLKGSLTPSRNNGFLNLLKLMQKKTLALQTLEQETKPGGNGGVSSSGREEPEIAAAGASSAGAAAGGSGAEAGAMMPGGSSGASAAAAGGGASSSSGGQSNGASASDRPVYRAMESKLRAALNPKELRIDDVSHQHAGHAGVHKGATETHFNVMVVSEVFEGKPTVQRHRFVYGVLKEEFANGLHALSLVTKASSEVA